MFLCTFRFKCYYRQIIPQPYNVVDFIRTYNRLDVYSFKQVEFIRKRVQMMTKVKDILNFINCRKEADTLVFVVSATNVSQSELLIVGSEVKKLT